MYSRTIVKAIAFALAYSNVCLAVFLFVCCWLCCFFLVDYRNYFLTTTNRQDEFKSHVEWFTSVCPIHSQKYPISHIVTAWHCCCWYWYFMRNVFRITWDNVIYTVIHMPSNLICSLNVRLCIFVYIRNMYVNHWICKGYAHICTRWVLCMLLVFASKMVL